MHIGTHDATSGALPVCDTFIQGLLIHKIWSQKKNSPLFPPPRLNPSF